MTNKATIIESTSDEDLKETYSTETKMITTNFVGLKMDSKHKKTELMVCWLNTAT